MHAHTYKTKQSLQAVKFKSLILILRCSSSDHQSESNRPPFGVLNMSYSANMGLPTLSPLRHTKELVLAGVGITVMDNGLTGQEAAFGLLYVIHLNACNWSSSSFSSHLRLCPVSSKSICIYKTMIKSSKSTLWCSPSWNATWTQLQNTVLS